jgi:hypothetical protein
MYIVALLVETKILVQERATVLLCGECYWMTLQEIKH